MVFAGFHYLRCGQYSRCGAGYVFWWSANEEAETEHHGSSQVCLQHLSDRLRPVAVLLRNEL